VLLPSRRRDSDVSLAGVEQLGRFPDHPSGELSPAAENGLIKRFSGVYGSAVEMGGTGLEPVTPSLSIALDYSPSVAIC